MGQSSRHGQIKVVRTWRELAYRNFEKLRDAPSDQARAQVAAEIETYAEVTAQILRQQLGYPSGSDSQERDAYCQANAKAAKLNPGKMPSIYY